MAEYTQNYNLKKPAEDDFYNVKDFNENADIVDEELKEVNDKVNSHLAENATDAHLPLNVGLGNVQNYGIASQAEAEAGIVNNKYMTPERVKQAIDKLATGGYNLLQTISIPDNSINIVNITNLDAYENIFIYIPILDCVGANEYIAISASPSPGATSRGYTLTGDGTSRAVFTNIGAEQILPQTYAPNGIAGFMIEIKNNSSQRKIIEVMGHVGTTSPGYSLFRKLAYESTKITTVSLTGTEKFLGAEVRVWGR